MSKRDDFLDDYIGYRIFEDSMKGSGSKPPKKNTGCGTWAVLIFIVIFLLGVFGSCSKSSPSRYSSSNHSYGTSYSTHSKSSNSSSSKSYFSALSGGKPASSDTSKSLSSSKYKSSSSAKKSSDPYDAKSYAHPDDFYYDNYDDFRDYEDAEEYWGIFNER